MKIKLGARCSGMREPDEETYEVPDDMTEEDLQKMAQDFGERVTDFDCWFEKIED